MQILLKPLNGDSLVPTAARMQTEWGLRLGEAVALSVLRDQNNNHVGEDFAGFIITKFDDTMVTV